MAGIRVHFIFSKDLLSRVDAVRGGLSRGAWVRERVEEGLKLEEERLVSERTPFVFADPRVQSRRVEEFRRASQR